MKPIDRYDTTSLPEAQFEPGSNDLVLRNKLGITSVDNMDKLEKEEQLRAMDELTNLFDSNHQFTAADISTMHKIWLGNVYDWAGKYRQVKMHKEDFTFAYPEHISKLMDEFEKRQLQKFTPCHFELHSDIAKALAVVHTELVIIHPFREGNGRVSRMLAILMGLQAGLPPLDFQDMITKAKEEYILAIQIGFGGNYAPMEKMFGDVIRKTMRARVLK
jgi:cell filamentation protein